MPAKSAPKIEKIESDASDFEEEAQQEEDEATQTQEEIDLKALKTYVSPAKKLKTEKVDTRTEKEKIIKKAGWTTYTKWVSEERERAEYENMSTAAKNELFKVKWKAVSEEEKAKLQAEVKKFKEIAHEKYPEEMKEIDEKKKKKRSRSKSEEPETTEGEGDTTAAGSGDEREPERKRSKGRKKSADERPAVSRNPRKSTMLGEFFWWKKMNPTVPQSEQKQAFKRMKDEKGETYKRVVQKVEADKEECARKLAQCYREDNIYRLEVLVSN